MKVNEILLFGVLCWHEKSTYQYTSTYSSDKDTEYATYTDAINKWVPRHYYFKGILILLFKRS
jgi:hypothetical protein